jgi:Tol biopolymer transport system component
MDAATGEIFQLTDYLFGFVNGIAPSWSPDSQWLTFWVEDRLFKVSADGGTPTLLMNAVGSARTSPVWSPDGQSIAFIASSIADTLYVVPSGGGQAESLTHRRIDSRSMSWSPDSEWLVYQTLRGEDIELYKIRRDGTEMQQLTDVPDAVSHSPIWSPAVGLTWGAKPLMAIAIVVALAPSVSMKFVRRQHMFT